MKDLGKHEVTNFIAGISAGSVIAGLFSPWDRALYISVTRRIAFFDRTCWKERRDPDLVASCPLSTPLQHFCTLSNC